MVTSKRVNYHKLIVDSLYLSSGDPEEGKKESQREQKEERKVIEEIRNKSDFLERTGLPGTLCGASPSLPHSCICGLV